MDLDLTDAQRALVDKAREASDRDLSPRAADVDREQLFPRDGISSLAKRGLIAVTVPKEWGGGGADTIACALVLEEVACACASTAAVVAVQSLAVCEPILRFGTEAQKRAWLPSLTAGDKLGCVALVEWDSSPTTTTVGFEAQREGDQFVLRGNKGLVTCAPVADVALVFAITARSERNNLTAFLVPLTSAGVSRGPSHSKLGLRGAASSSLVLDGVRLPADAVLGAEGGGSEVLRLALDGSRMGAAALSVGVARAAYGAATRYLHDSRNNGQPLASHQAVQFKLAEMSTHIDAARLLTWRAAAARDAGASVSTYASMAKVAAAEAVLRTAGDAIQVLGSNGCLATYPVERHFRDAKVLEIYEDTSEGQRLGIASALLKE